VTWCRSAAGVVPLVRACFLSWLLPAVGLVNLRTSFSEIVSLVWGSKALADLKKAYGVWGSKALADLKKAYGVGTTTFPKWFQLRLGEVLIKEGMKAATRTNSGKEPHWFKPMVTSVHWKKPLVLPPAPDMEEDKAHRSELVDLRDHPRPTCHREGTTPKDW